VNFPTCRFAPKHGPSGDMSNTYFEFKQFRIEQDRCAMKVSTDACLFGAWVAEQIRQDPVMRTSALDIGGGTGLLSLMLAQALPEIRLTCLEINKDVAEQAAENIMKSSWSDRICVVNGDIKEADDRNLYEIIVSNPPFYEQDLASPDTNKNQAHHDTSLNMEQLLECIARLLTKSGAFFLLLPARKIEQRIEAISRCGFSIHHQAGIRHTKDQPVKRYFLSGQRTGGAEKLISQIVLMDENGHYEKQASALLGDYYLKG